VFDPPEDDTAPEARLTTRPFADRWDDGEVPAWVARRGGPADGPAKERRPFVALAVGLGVGAALLLLLTCAGGIGAVVWYAAVRGHPVQGGHPAIAAARAPAEAAKDAVVPLNPDPPPAAPEAPPVPPEADPALPDLPVPPGLPGFPGLPGMQPGGPPRFQGAPNVTVILTGIRDDRTLKSILERLVRLLPRDNHSMRSTTSGDVTQVTLAPVDDAQALADKIDFGTVTRVAGRVIYVTVKE
jgi:hypothetical protein